MEFHNFDLSEYFRSLTEFKKTHTDEIVRQMGGMEQFDEMLLELKSHESEIADMAVKQYGSLERFTEAMKHNFQDFLSNGGPIEKSEVGGMIEKTDELTRGLTADLGREVTSPEVQKIVGELISYTEETNKGIDMGEHYWSYLAESHLSNPVYIKATDKKYGKGASNYIGLALKAYLDIQ